MIMEILVKAAAVSVVGAVLAIVLKKNSPEMALLLTVSLGCLVLYLAVDVVTNVAQFMDDLSSVAGISSASLAIVMKTVGIAILTKLAAGICSDAGQGSVASALELMGSAAALYIALPLMKTVFQMVSSLV